MASSTSNVSDSNTQKQLSPAVIRMGQERTAKANEKVLEKIRAKYPGGLEAFIADYTGERKTMAQLLSVIPIQYRAFMRAFSLLGVPLREKSRMMILARKLNPSWNENISRGKLLCPTRHSPETLSRAAMKRAKLFRENPLLHGQANVTMSHRERTVKAMCDRHGVNAIFNQAADGYFLDFYFPELRIGMEVQRNESIPDKKRCDSIMNTLNLRTLLYVPGHYLFTGNAGYIDSLIQTLAKDCESIADAIGDARFLCQRQSEVAARWYGFGFKHKWEDATPPAELQTPTADQPAR